MNVSQKRLGLLVLLLMLSLMPGRVGQAQSDSLVLNSESNCEPAAELRLALLDGAMDGEFELFLCNTADEAIEDAHLAVSVHDEENRPLSGVRLLEDEPVTLQPGEPVAVTLAVEDIRHVGEFNGQLRVGEHSLAFVLARVNLPTITVLEAEVATGDAPPTITFAPTASTFRLPLRLVLAADNRALTLTDVSVSWGELVREDAIVDGLVPTLEVGDLPPLHTGAYQSVDLTGTLPAYTTYRGWLMFEYLGKHDVYELSITRSAPAAFIVDGADDGSLELPFSGDSFDAPVTVRLAAGRPAIDDLTVSIAEVRADGQALDGERTTITCEQCDQDPITLTSDEPLVIDLHGTGLDRVPHTAQLRLRYADEAPHIVALTVSPRDVVDNLKLSDATFETSTWSWSPLAKPDVEISISVKEIGGRTTQVKYPTLDELQRTLDSKTQTVTDYEYTVYERVNGELEKLDDPSGTMDLPGGDTINFVLRVTGLDAGQYTGSVTVAGDSSQAASRAVDIKVKHTPIYATIVIFLGAAGSAFANWWVKRGRNRAKRAYKTEQARAEIESKIPDEADPVRLHLLDWLGRADEIELSDAQGFSNWLSEIRNRTRLYPRAQALRQTAYGLLANFPATDEPVQNCSKAALVGELETKWIEVLTEFKSPETNKIADIRTKVGDIEKLQPTIRDCIVKNTRKTLGARVEELVSICQDVSDDLAAQVTTLKTDFDAIPADVSEAQFAGVVDQLNRLTERYVDLRMRHLRERVAQVRAAPEAYDAVENHLQDTLASLDAAAESLDDRLANLAAARHHYLAAMLAYIKADTDHLIGVEANQPAKERAEPIKEELDQAIAEAQAAWRLGGRRGADAEQVYANRIQPQYRTLLDMFSAETFGPEHVTGVDLFGEVDTPDGGAPEPPEPPRRGFLALVPRAVVSLISFLPMAPWVDPVQVSEEKRRYQTLRTGDWIVWGLVLVLATVSGLKTQWYDSATFGSMLDYINALLWGFSVSAGATLVDIATQYERLG